MEENKVAQKLEDVVFAAIPSQHDVVIASEVTKAILQSPDLRVTLVEPRYKVTGHYSECPYQYWVMESQHGGGAVCISKLEDAKRAEEYAAYLNSKEPK